MDQGTLKKPSPITEGGKKMIVRIYEDEQEYYLPTIVRLLWNADQQANFHPSTMWIEATGDKEKDSGRTYQDVFIRWPGREPILVWLSSNQVLFEIITYDLLISEEKALGEQLKEEGEPHHADC